MALVQELIHLLDPFANKLPSKVLPNPRISLAPNAKRHVHAPSTIPSRQNIQRGTDGTNRWRRLLHGRCRLATFFTAYPCPNNSDQENRESRRQSSEQSLRPSRANDRRADGRSNHRAHHKTSR